MGGKNRLLLLLPTTLRLGCCCYSNSNKDLLADITFYLILCNRCMKCSFKKIKHQGLLFATGDLPKSLSKVFYLLIIQLASPLPPPLAHLVQTVVHPLFPPSPSFP